MRVPNAESYYSGNIHWVLNASDKTIQSAVMQRVSWLVSCQMLMVLSQLRQADLKEELRQLQGQFPR
jgi:hypothetical protein